MVVVVVKRPNMGNLNNLFLLIKGHMTSQTTNDENMRKRYERTEA